MEITYDYYRIFYYVAKYKSFSRAATVLMSNQPNITRFMNNLESQLGCRLFVRSNRGVSLTPEGEKLYKHVAVAYQHLQAAEVELANDKTLNSGVVTIGASDTALHILLLPILRKFRQEYPGVHIRILNHATLQAIQSVNDGLADFAVVTSPLDLSHPQRETVLMHFQDILIGSNRYRFLSHEKNHLADLEKYPLISLGKDTKSYVFYNRLYLKYGLVMHPDTEAASIDQILPLIQNDLGIGFIPRKLASPALDQGLVCEIPLVEDIPLRCISLIEDCSRPLSIAATAMKRMLLANT